ACRTTMPTAPTARSRASPKERPRCSTSSRPIRRPERATTSSSPTARCRASNGTGHSKSSFSCSKLRFVSSRYSEGRNAMAYTLEQLSDDIRTALKADPGVGGKQAVVKLVSKVLLDKDFVDKHLRAEDCKPRKVLYEDPELGFCVCGHVYEKPAHGEPH